MSIRLKICPLEAEDFRPVLRGRISAPFPLQKSIVFSQMQNYNKRAMMALDCSPESFSPQMNSTSFYLCFQLVIPSFDTKGHHTNKIDKGLQADATYQISKLYPFQFQRRRILKLVFFVPIFQLVTPRNQF